MTTAARTPAERSGALICPRDHRGRLLPSVRTALERFAAKCDFDPATGCVLWTGAKTAGRGNSATYGKFRNERGESEYAHRWAARAIHGLAIDGVPVGHCCKPLPNTLCVQHLEATTTLENLAELNGRLAERRQVQQSAQERQYYLFVSLGLEPEPPQYEPDPNAVLWYRPPAWFTAARPDYVLPPLAEVPF